MKFRVLSDLHIDVNRSYPFDLPKRDQGMFTVLAGDTSGDPLKTRDWIEKNLKEGVFVSGNHLVYNDRGKGIDELRAELAWEHGKDDPMTYLDALIGEPCVVKEKEGILFVGSALYTNFLLPYKWDYEDEERQDGPPELKGNALTRVRNGQRSEMRMNDYRWGRVRGTDGSLRRMSYEDYLKWFDKSFAAIKKVVEDNPDKEIVVVTHFCPSPKCIDEGYLDSDVNSSYVSNLEEFITSHPNIKCWCCGHVHHQDSFKVGDCLVVMNPRGYVGRCEDANFDRRLYVDTSDWSIHKHKRTQKEQKEYNERKNKYLSAMAWFF